MSIYDEWLKIEQNPNFAAEPFQVKEYVQRKFLAKRKDVLRSMSESERKAVIARVRGIANPDMVAAQQQANTMQPVKVGRVGIPFTDIGTDIVVSPGAASQFEQGTTMSALRAGERLATGDVRTFRETGMNVPILPGAEKVPEPSNLLETRQENQGRGEGSGYSPLNSLEDLSYLPGDALAGFSDLMINIPKLGEAMLVSNEPIQSDLSDRMKVAASDPIEAAANTPVGKVAAPIIKPIAGPIIDVGSQALKKYFPTLGEKAVTTAAEKVAREAEDLARRAMERRVGAPPSPALDLPSVPNKTGFKRATAGVGKLAAVEGATEFVQEGATAIAEDYGRQGQVITDLRDQIKLETNQGASPARLKQLQDQLKIEEAKKVNLGNALTQASIGAVAGTAIGGAAQLATNRGDYIRQMKSGQFLVPQQERAVGAGLIAASRSSRRAKGGYVGGVENATKRVQEALKINNDLNQERASLGVEAETVRQELLSLDNDMKLEMKKFEDYTANGGDFNSYDFSAINSLSTQINKLNEKAATIKMDRDAVAASQAPLHNLLADVYGSDAAALKAMNNDMATVLSGGTITLPKVPAALMSKSDSRSRDTSTSPFRATQAPAPATVQAPVTGPVPPTAGAATAAAAGAQPFALNIAQPDFNASQQPIQAPGSATPVAPAQQQGPRPDPAFPLGKPRTAPPTAAQPAQAPPAVQFQSAAVPNVQAAQETAKRTVRRDAENAIRQQLGMPPVAAPAQRSAQVAPQPQVQSQTQTQAPAAAAPRYGANRRIDPQRARTIEINQFTKRSARAEKQIEKDWRQDLRPMSQQEAIEALGVDPDNITEEDQAAINELRDRDADGNRNPKEGRQERLLNAFKANNIPVPDKTSAQARKVLDRAANIYLFQYMIEDPDKIYNLSPVQKQKLRNKLGDLQSLQSAEARKSGISLDGATALSSDVRALTAEYNRLSSLGRREDAQKIALRLDRWHKSVDDPNAPNRYILGENGEFLRDDQGNLLRNPDYVNYFLRKAELEAQEAERLRQQEEERKLSEKRRQDIRESRSARERADVEERIAESRREQEARRREAELAHLNAEQKRLYEKALVWLDGKSADDLLKILDGLERKIDSGDLSYRTIAYLRATVERLDEFNYSFLTDEMDGPTDVEVDTLSEPQLLDLWNGLLDTEWDGADEEWAMDKAAQVRDRLTSLGYTYDRDAEVWVKNNKPKPPSGPKKGRGKKGQTGKTLFDAAAEAAAEKASDESQAPVSENTANQKGDSGPAGGLDSDKPFDTSGAAAEGLLAEDDRSRSTKVDELMVKAYDAYDEAYNALDQAFLTWKENNPTKDVSDTRRGSVFTRTTAVLRRMAEAKDKLRDRAKEIGYESRMLSGEMDPWQYGQYLKDEYGYIYDASTRSWKKRGYKIQDAIEETVDEFFSEASSLFAAVREANALLGEFEIINNKGRKKKPTPSNPTAEEPPTPVKNLDELRLSLEAAVGEAVSKMKQLGPLAASVIINSEKKLETKVLNFNSGYPDYKTIPIREFFDTIVLLILNGKRNDVLSLIREINRLEPSGLVAKEGLQKRKDIVMLLVLRAMDAADRKRSFSTYEPGKPAPEKKPQSPEAPAGEPEAPTNEQGPVVDEEESAPPNERGPFDPPYENVNAERGRLTNLSDEDLIKEVDRIVGELRNIGLEISAKLDSKLLDANVRKNKQLAQSAAIIRGDITYFGRELQTEAESVKTAASLDLKEARLTQSVKNKMIEDAVENFVSRVDRTYRAFKDASESLAELNSGAPPETPSKKINFSGLGRDSSIDVRVDGKLAYRLTKSSNDSYTVNGNLKIGITGLYGGVRKTVGDKLAEGLSLEQAKALVTALANDDQAWLKKFKDSQEVGIPVSEMPKQRAHVFRRLLKGESKGLGVFYSDGKGIITRGPIDKKNIEKGVKQEPFIGMPSVFSDGLNGKDVTPVAFIQPKNEPWGFVVFDNGEHVVPAEQYQVIINNAVVDRWVYVEVPFKALIAYGKFDTPVGAVTPYDTRLSPKEVQKLQERVANGEFSKKKEKPSGLKAVAERDLDQARLFLETPDRQRAVAKMKFLGAAGQMIVDLMPPGLYDSAKFNLSASYNLESPTRLEPIFAFSIASLDGLGDGKKVEELANKLLYTADQAEMDALSAKSDAEKKKLKATSDRARVAALLVLRGIDANARGETISMYEPGRPKFERKVEPIWKPEPPAEKPTPANDEDAALDAALSGTEKPTKPDTMGSEEDALDAALGQLEAAPQPKKPKPPKPPTPPKSPGGGKPPATPPAPPADSGLSQAMKRLGSDMRGSDAFGQLGMAGLGAAAVISYLAGDPSANELALASLAFLTPKQYEFFAKKGAYIVQTLNDTYAATRAAADRIRLDEWITEFGSFIRSLGNDKITQVLEKLEASRDALIGMFRGSLLYRKKVKQYVDQNGLDGVDDVEVEIPEEIQNANPPSPPGDEEGAQGQPGDPGRTGDADDGGDVTPGRGGEGQGGGAAVLGEPGGVAPEAGVPPARARGEFQPVARLNPRIAEPAFEDLPSSGNARIDEQRRADYEAARNSEVVGPYVRRGDWSGVAGRSHPRLVVETRSLQGAPYPELDYQVAQPVLDAIQRGAVSVEQADVIAAAGQANDNGHGILVADDVGLGKSREVAGIALDWLTSGKAKTLVVITKGESNVGDLFGDQGLSRTPKKSQAATADEVVADLGEFGVTADGPFPYPILRMRGDNLKDAEGAKALREFTENDGPRIVVVDSYNFATYADRIIALQPDALIADEAHMFKTKPKETNKGAKWYDLHAAMMSNPQARFAYMTATPASDVSELFYLHGLREWPMTAEVTDAKGRKKGDDRDNGFNAWVRMKTGTASEADLALLQSAAEAGEIPPLPTGIMPATEGARRMNEYSPSLQEQVVREFKMGGKYIARDLWRGGVEFRARPVNRTLFEMNELQQFNALAREIKRLARESVSGVVPPGVRIRASFVFAQIQAASKTRQAQPRLRAAVALAKQALKEGRRPVISVVSVSAENLLEEPKLTKEGRQALREEIARVTGNPNGKWLDLPETVRLEWLKGNLIAAIEAINDRRYEYITEDGRRRIVDVGPNEAMVASKIMLLRQAQDLSPTYDPVDLMRDEFGADNVTAITGNVPIKERRDLIKDFQDGKRKVAIISGAGKTGLSLHHVLDESKSGSASKNQSDKKNTVVSEFETSKGSVYKVFGDGTTQRDKAPRPEHPGDSGIKERTSRTIYVDGNAARLSPAGIEGVEAFGVYLKNGKATLAWRGVGQPQLGASPSGRDVPFYDTPALGRSPLELWSPKGDGSYTGVHAGNEIVKIIFAAADSPQPVGQREMIITDYEWTAPAVKQEMGRVDRAGQLTPPIITLLHTGSPAEKKFLATIASRMAGLGAISKGQSDSTNTDALSSFEIGGAADNAAARVAMASVFRDVINDFTENLNTDEAVQGVEFLRDLREKFTNDKIVDFLDGVIQDEQIAYDAALESGVEMPDRTSFRREQIAYRLEALTRPQFFRDMNSREFLKELQMMPDTLASKAFDSFEEARNNDESAARYRADRATKKRSGRIVREYKVDDRTFYYDVEANDGSRFSILSGAVTEKYGTLQERVPGEAFQEARTYSTFRDERDGYTITGLIVPDRLRPAVRLALNIKYQPTAATAFDDLVAGDQIPLGNGMTLMPPKETLDSTGNRLPDERMVFVVKGATPSKVFELADYGAFIPEGSRQVMIKGRQSVTKMAEDFGVADQAELDRVNAIPADRRVNINISSSEKVQIEGVINENSYDRTLDIRKTDADKLFPGSLLTINGVRYGVAEVTKDLVPAAVFNGAGLGVRLKISPTQQDSMKAGMLEMRAGGKLFAVSASRVTPNGIELLISPELAKAAKLGTLTEVTINGNKLQVSGFRPGPVVRGVQTNGSLLVSGDIETDTIDAMAGSGTATTSQASQFEKDFTALVAALMDKKVPTANVTADAAVIMLKKNAKTAQEKRVVELIANGVKKMRKKNLGIDVVFGDNTGLDAAGFANSSEGNAADFDLTSADLKNAARYKTYAKKASNLANARNNVVVFIGRDTRGLSEFTILAHEMIHAITVLEMRKNPSGPETQSIEKIFGIVKNLASMEAGFGFAEFSALRNGLTPGTREYENFFDRKSARLLDSMLENSREFIAYLLTEEDFQEYLKSIDLKGVQVGPSKISAKLQRAKSVAKSVAAGDEKGVRASIFRAIATVITRILDGVSKDVPAIENIMNAVSSMSYSSIESGPFFVSPVAKSKDPGAYMGAAARAQADLSSKLFYATESESEALYSHPGNLEIKNKFYKLLESGNIEALADEMIKVGYEKLRENGIVLSAGIDPTRAFWAMVAVTGHALKAGVGAVNFAAIKIPLAVVAKVWEKSVGLAQLIRGHNSRSVAAANAAKLTGTYRGGAAVNYLMTWIFGPKYKAPPASTSTPYAPKYVPGSPRESTYELEQRTLPIIEERIRKLSSRLYAAARSGDSKKFTEIAKELEAEKQKLKDATDRVTTLRAEAEALGEGLTDGSGIPPFTGVMAPDPVGVNITKLDTEDEVKDFLGKMLEDGKRWFFDQTAAAKRGFGEVQSEAIAKLKSGDVDIDRVAAWDFTKGLPTDAEMLAGRIIMVTLAEHVQKLAKQYEDDKAAATVTDAQRTEFMRMMELLLSVSAAVEGSTKGIARALNAHKILARTNMGVLRAVESISQNYKFGKYDAIDKAIERIAKVDSLIDDAGKAKAEVLKPKSTWLSSIMSQIAEIWLAKILSAIATHARNLTGFATRIAKILIEGVAQSGFGAVRGVPPSERATLGEVAAILSAISETLWDSDPTASLGSRALGLATLRGEARRVAAVTYRTGAAAGPVGQLDVKPSAFDALPDSSWRKKYAKILHAISFDALQAADEGFKTVFYRIDMMRQAYRRAYAKLGNDATYEQLMEEARNILEDEDQVSEMHDAAVDVAIENSYQAPGGPHMRALTALKAEFPLLTFVIPFVRTPGNFLKFLIRNTPLLWRLSSEARADIEAGGTRGDARRAAIFVNGLQALLVALLTMNGNITGAPPNDPKEREAWLNAGNQAYSVKAFDWQLQYNIQLGPEGLAIGMVADAVQAAKESIYRKKMDPEMTWGDAAARAAWFGTINAMRGVVIEQTFMRGVDDVSAVVQGSDKAQAYVSNLLATLAGPSNFVRKIADMDPYGPVEVRDDSPLLETRNRIQAAIPGGRRGIPFLPGFEQPLNPKTTQLGTPAGKSQLERIGSAFLPATPTKKKTDVVYEELLRLGISPSKFGKEIGVVDPFKITTTEDERAMMRRLRGNNIYGIIKDVINSPDYDYRSVLNNTSQPGQDYARAEIIREILAAGFGMSKEQFLGALSQPEFEKRAARAQGNIMRNREKYPY